MTIILFIVQYFVVLVTLIPAKFGLEYTSSSYSGKNTLKIRYGESEERFIYNIMGKGGAQRYSTEENNFIIKVSHQNVSKLATMNSTVSTKETTLKARKRKMAPLLILGRSAINLMSDSATKQSREKIVFFDENSISIPIMQHNLLTDLGKSNFYRKSQNTANVSTLSTKSTVVFSNLNSNSNHYNRTLRRHFPSFYCQNSKTGHFPHPSMCNAYVNCRNGKGTYQMCIPHDLVFDPLLSQCLYNKNSSRIDDSCHSSLESQYKDFSSGQTLIIDASRPSCLDFKSIGYECVKPTLCVNGQISHTSEDKSVETRMEVRARNNSRIIFPTSNFFPWRKDCPGNLSLICCKNPLHYRLGIKESLEKNLALCPGTYSGRHVYLLNCSKYVNCWKGKTLSIEECPAGSYFNKLTKECDTFIKAKCTIKKDKVNSLRNTDYLRLNDPEIIVQGRSRSVLDVVRQSVQPEENDQIIRLRGGTSPYSGYLELFHVNEWGVVCDNDVWNMNEAKIVCNELGFKRGVYSTTQGQIFGEINEGRKMTDRIMCEGDETSLSMCLISYKNKSANTNSCKLSENAVSVTCIHDSYTACDLNEVPWGGKCYSINFPPATFSKADETCKASNKTLLEISSQSEKHIISELLLHSSDSDDILKDVWIAHLKKSAWNSKYKFWSHEISSDKHNFGSKLSRRLGDSGKQLTNDYFVAMEDLNAKLPFFCVSPQKEIGCIIGNGANYSGNARRSESGKECANLDLQMHQSNFSEVAYCRNPDNDVSPWCYLKDGIYDYCDIPQCQDETNNMDVFLNGRNDNNSLKIKCSPNQLQCQVGECVMSVYVCDGTKDCSNGIDEMNCPPKSISFFQIIENNYFDTEYLEYTTGVTLNTCATKCLEAISTITHVCISFSYNNKRNICVLTEHKNNEVPSSYQDNGIEWDYYEKIHAVNETKQNVTHCSTPNLYCLTPNKDVLCLTEKEVCSGVGNCMSGTVAMDELECRSDALTNIRLRLVNGSVKHEGRVEISAFNQKFGGICDDGFGIEEANMICSELGYPKGAEHVMSNSLFGHGDGLILLDELKCKRNDSLSSFNDCTFKPWKQHDCGNDEWIGVRCKINTQNCNHKEWKCSSGECIALTTLCDGEINCADASDESVSFKQCSSDNLLRISDGNGLTTGRVEMRHNGIWGTICDDNFGEKEAIVSCRMLGFEGVAHVFTEAKFGPGSGPIWMYNVSCNGMESSLDQCVFETWGPTQNCIHWEDVSIECIPTRRSEKIKRGNPLGQFGDDVSCGLSSVSDSIESSTIRRFPMARLTSAFQSRPGAQPWASSIRILGSNNQSIHWCGAVLISEIHLLSVAHCFDEYPKDSYIVLVGDWDTQVEDPWEQRFRIDKIHFHEDYNKGVYLSNDIAFVKIKRSESGKGVIFNNRVSPACLPSQSLYYGTHMRCQVVSWGSMTSFQPQLSRFLQIVTVPYLDTETCMSPQVYGPEKLSASMYCAGHLEGGSDTCQGDSGSGMYCLQSGRMQVVGLTSWGYGCGRPNRPGVYTKVAYFIEWIRFKMIND